MKLMIAALAAVALAGCTAPVKTESVGSTLQIQQYNSVGAVYMPRPTFVSISDMSDGSQVLRIALDRYGGDRRSLLFMKGTADTTTPLIDKYLEWEALAKSRGDTITKEIGRARIWAGAGVDGFVRADMHSGNKSMHYLALTFCTRMVCLDEWTLFLDRKAAIELRQLLIDFDAGRVKASDSSVYK